MTIFEPSELHKILLAWNLMAQKYGLQVQKRLSPEERGMIWDSGMEIDDIVISIAHYGELYAEKDEFDYFIYASSVKEFFRKECYSKFYKKEDTIARMKRRTRGR